MELSDLIVVLLTGGVGAAIVKLIDNVIQASIKRKEAREGRASITNEDLAASIKSVKDELSSTKVGVRIVLQDQIEKRAQECLSRGKISMPERERIINMHDVYHNDLGGNGNLDSVMEKVLELEIK